jgi:hypothetical protein
MWDDVVEQGEPESPGSGGASPYRATLNAERSLPREQLETRQGAPNIRILKRMWVILFHACDLVDSAVGFKHIDD